MRKLRPIALIVATMLMAGLPLAWAQQQQQGPRNNDRQQRWQQMRQRMEQRMKQTLGVDDQTWKVLQPRIEKVMQLRRELRSGGRGMGRMFRGRRGGQDQGNRPNRSRRTDNRPQTDISKAASDLRTTLEDTKATNDQIKAKLEALRAARTKVQNELTKAQADLQSLVTVHQEAELVLMGVLE